MGQSEKVSQKTQAAVSPEGWQDFLGEKEGEVHHRQTRAIVTMSCSREHIPLSPVGLFSYFMFSLFLNTKSSPSLSANDLASVKRK